MSPPKAAQERHVLLTGGAGYLGSVLVPTLLDLGYEVSVVDRCFFGRDSLAPVMAHPHFRFYEDDISRVDLLASLLGDEVRQTAKLEKGAGGLPYCAFVFAKK